MTTEEALLLQDLIKEVKELRREVMLLRGKKPNKPIMNTSEAAEVLNLTSRMFRRKHVDTGNINPVKDHKCLFYRKDVELLKSKCKKLKEWVGNA